MRYFIISLVLFSVVNITKGEENEEYHIDVLLNEIKNALNAGGSYDEGQIRQYQNYYRPPQNTGISLGVYEALRSIARNDDLKCVSRLLCEAAAGGQPGFSGKQIKFDKLSLTSLLSYLNLDTANSSPLLVFGRAALLGVSNRGDPYSCIINYPKCPKDQSRLLYYLNNHRGGFFQYFDKKHRPLGNYYYQNYQKKFKGNTIQFQEGSKGVYGKYKKKTNGDIYAKKYPHSPLKFPVEEYGKYRTQMVFPDDRNSPLNPRILSGPKESYPVKNNFVFNSYNRYPKQLNGVNGGSTFFPQKDHFREPADLISDRLPSKFYFPQDDSSIKYLNYPVKYSTKTFFPSN